MLPCYGLYLKCMFHFIMLHAYTLIKSKFFFFFFSVQDTEDKGPASIICIAKKKAYHTYIYQLVQKTRWQWLHPKN